MTALGYPLFRGLCLAVAGGLRRGGRESYQEEGQDGWEICAGASHHPYHVFLDCKIGQEFTDICLIHLPDPEVFA